MKREAERVLYYCAQCREDRHIKLTYVRADGSTFCPVCQSILYDEPNWTRRPKLQQEND